MAQRQSRCGLSFSLRFISLSLSHYTAGGVDSGSVTVIPEDMICAVVNIILIMQEDMHKVII